MAALLLPAITPSASAAARVTPVLGANSSPVTNISYNSSADGFPLSYAEELPAHFVARHSYPLLVYLHGKGKDSVWTPGGSGNGLSNYLSNRNPSGQELRSIVANASHFGFIIIAPSPRTSEGFYTNSSCGGPQEQDTLDAIAAEEALRHISSVYLLGFSMGSTGALSLAGHHPGQFAGVAVTGTITDTFEDYAYHPGNATGYLTMTCGQTPSPTNTSADALMAYLSVARLVPTNFSSTHVWVSSGGQDSSATNNLRYWPFLQVNDTFYNSSCLAATAYGEPTGCTTPFLNLSLAHPGQYHVRSVYEALGVHALSQLSARDMFEYFLGTVGDGCYLTSYPPGAFSSCP